MTGPNPTPETPSLGWRALLTLIRRVPQATLSRSLGRLADIPLPRPLRKPVLHSFARATGARVSEAEKPLHDYESVNAFFVRKLKPGLRTWPRDPDAVASPVDGIVGSVGRIHNGTALQAKGRTYSIGALLGDPNGTESYEGGLFVTLYLSPRHYHRIHAPVGGRVSLARHVPGRLFPVNPPAVSYVPNLFPRNERVFCQIESAYGPVALVAVGAFNVARISVAFDPEWSGPEAWVSNRRRPPAPERRYDPPLTVRRSDELMAFYIGSTAVILLPPGLSTPTDFCEPGREVRLGQPLAQRTGRSDLPRSQRP